MLNWCCSLEIALGLAPLYSCTAQRVRSIIIVTIVIIIIVIIIVTTNINNHQHQHHIIIIIIIIMGCVISFSFNHFRVGIDFRE